MKKRTKIWALVAVATMWLSAIACGGEAATPAAIGDIPAYPGATLAEAGDNMLVDMVVEAMEQAAVEEEAQVDTEVYTVAADASWGDIKSFYADSLADTDWEAADELTEDSEAFKSVGYQRGGLASEQALVIAYVPDPLGGDTSLVIMLLSE